MGRRYRGFFQIIIQCNQWIEGVIVNLFLGVDGEVNVETTGSVLTRVMRKLIKFVQVQIYSILYGDDGEMVGHICIIGSA